MLFAKRVFLLAGVTGVPLLIVPYFLERRAGEFDPPPLNHPEYYYGFLGVTLAWQLMYLLIASDPVRYRPVMLLGSLGKSSFFAAVAALYAAGRVAPLWLGFASMDAALVVLFLVAYWLTPRGQADSRGS